MAKRHSCNPGCLSFHVIFQAALFKPGVSGDNGTVVKVSQDSQIVENTSMTRAFRRRPSAVLNVHKQLKYRPTRASMRPTLVRLDVSVVCRTLSTFRQSVWGEASLLRESSIISLHSNLSLGVDSRFLALFFSLSSDFHSGLCL